MSKKLYIGNLPFTSTEADLRDLFGRHGTVASVNVITDREVIPAAGSAPTDTNWRPAREASIGT